MRDETTRETQWAQRLLDTNCKVWLLEHRNGANLYRVQRWYPIKNTWFGDVATFHVWKNGQHVLAITNYLEALHRWEAEANDAL